MKRFIDDIGRIWAISFLTLFSSSCVEWVSLNTQDEREIVVNCVLTESSEQILDLFWSKRNDDEGSFEAIREATISLFIEEQDDWNLVGDFTCGIDGRWRLAYRPKYGNKYRLAVVIAGKQVHATTIMPPETEVVFNPNPRLILDPMKVYACLYPSRMIRRNNVSSEHICFMAYFTKGEEVVEQLYTTHTGVEKINYLNKGRYYRYLTVPPQADSTSFILDHGHRYSIRDEDAIWTEYYLPYYPRAVLVVHERDYAGTYLLPTVIPITAGTSSNDELSALSLIPSFGTFERMYTLWGPNFDIWPRDGEAADKLHFLFPSEDLYLYCKDMQERQQRLLSFDFTELFRAETPYTNIIGGKGIFGAMTIQEEDYTDYLERLYSCYEKLASQLL